METLQIYYFWEQFVTVGTEMKSHQLSLILDIVNPLITVLRLTFSHYLFVNSFR